MRLTSEKINPLIASYDFIVISTHQDFKGSKNMVNILTINSILVDIDIIQVVMSMVPHNPQFTRSFQMSPLGIKLSKIVIIFFTFQ